MATYKYRPRRFDFRNRNGWLEGKLANYKKNQCVTDSTYHLWYFVLLRTRFRRVSAFKGYEPGIKDLIVEFCEKFEITPLIEIHENSVSLQMFIPEYVSVEMFVGWLKRYIFMGIKEGVPIGGVIGNLLWEGHYVQSIGGVSVNEIRKIVDK